MSLTMTSSGPWSSVRNSPDAPSVLPDAPPDPNLAIHGAGRDELAVAAERDARHAVGVSPSASRAPRRFQYSTDIRGHLRRRRLR